MRNHSMSAGFVTKLVLVGTALVAMALAGSAANASPVTLTLDFTASGFTPVLPSPAVQTAPVDPVTGEITLTFDPTVNVNTDTKTGITLDSLNINADLVASSLVFQYQDFGFASILTFGTNQGGAGLGVSTNTDAFEAVIEDPVTSVLDSGAAPPTLLLFTYSQKTLNNNFSTETGTATASVVQTSVPEPGTLALFGAGLMGVGGFTTLRRRKATKL